MRYPHDKLRSQVTPLPNVNDPLRRWGVVDSASGFTQLSFAKIGIDDDYFMDIAGDYSYGPPYYANPGNPWYDWTSFESPYLPMDGEMEWGDNTNVTVSGLNATLRFRLQHFSTFSHVHGFCTLMRLVHGPSIDSPCGSQSIDIWRTTPLSYSDLAQWGLPLEPNYNTTSHTIYDYIRDHLGYRLILQTATYDTMVSSGQNVNLFFSLINWGFSTLINPRNAYTVLLDGVDPTSKVVLQVQIPDLNAQTWQPHLPGDPTYWVLVHTITHSFTIPSSIPAGKYFIGVILPDSDMNYPHSSVYSVAFANNDTLWWSDSYGNYGVNILGPIAIQSSQQKKTSFVIS